MAAAVGLGTDCNDSFVAHDKSAKDLDSVESTSNVHVFPGQDTTKSDGSPRDSVELSNEAQEIRTLQLRDREVRAHEAAHAAAGGAYAGSPSYTFEQGADGKSYAVGGSVSIDISPVSGDPEATLQKAQQIRAAALAPAQPSSQDMRVAQKAQSMAATAQREIAQQLNETMKNFPSDLSSSDNLSEAQADSVTTDSSSASSSGFVHLDFYT